ncbi:ABC transporter permease [Brachybacterium phenoliresistens]|uniref:ABC transporter permease n=1 Tax=Brachybacterium phenoliresistens TaxID=396014 RepID=UPI0031D33573
MTALDAPRVRGTGPLRSGTVLIGRSLRHSLRDGEGLVMAVALPVMMLLLFTYVFGGAILDDGYIDFVVPGVILTCAGFGASSVAVAVNRDLHLGAMRRFRTLPIRSWTVLVGHVAASVLRNLLATAIVIAVALALGFRPTAGPGRWALVVILVALWILAITALFAGIGMIAGSPEAASGYGFVLLFLPYLSSAFVPTETMPSWLRPVAEHQPMGPLVDALRALLIGGAVVQLLPPILWSLGITAAAGVLVTQVLRRSQDR